MSGILNSSIGRKFAMALSAFFLMIFLLQHFAINSLSVFSADAFNEVSHFMGTNWLIQFVMQPILMFGVVFHFVMGFVLEIRNRKARHISYAKNNGAANSTWMSRNMIYSGLFILIFLIIHFLDFWFPEINTKYIQGDMSGLLADGEGYRYFEELQHKFEPVWRVALYCVGFVFLALHLLHGFNSAFQSVGANNKYTKGLKGFGKAYAILIPLGFIVIALVHHFNH
ncbi:MULTISPECIES: succinate dehydrogenase cytochrome b subunit [Xanthomarina]|jgi:succinate dehydrogenase / fumarate reductase cytochrome b subunit|uniref:Succinate dehydrogenase n=2 Tax=Xanthomarina gelatinilytica TaxID=1137281 RepID=A0A3C0F160_9FLAO|nr:MULTISPECIES: succinate dehydrogenase cytochrome b subunit [Xanthomarina]MCB0388448.1 succinate dehydrogenase cytochrome b subunit [Winogradskyella sp.]MAL22262.1 succinate dehydrogenase [Xanthomarina sp.]MBF60800.1 succinate dehydrogenase [Xanthomarina sp.]MDX1316256.1 succinate dehydrogenase cytochrome b subunit [Xanthomarina gelatinilytica]HAB27779.1 succinate dehydrogenase [Xanthomarina gelatinilytica]|tara:strand:+ start:167 stop:844 length:678 start_codon:yes stop_codon:yes gene_type:complete|eukprot:TRINITY_DN18521_c0_g1_i1.p1 TRINITY_DN18521_c0_g1~~TRINITY_DN18521_c0_g1_i1.p1  ORF type:complete len:226 (+),score=6.67 TRINITY_DN18521_c0_g1_i1:96-773(+)